MSLAPEVFRLVGKEIGDFLTPVDILMVVDQQVNANDDLYEQLRIKSEFVTRLEAVADLWQFNQPELESQILFFQDHSVFTDRGEEFDNAIKKIETVIREYLAGLDLALWKYMPMYGRLHYSDFFEDVPSYRVEKLPAGSYCACRMFHD